MFVGGLRSEEIGTGGVSESTAKCVIVDIKSSVGGDTYGLRFPSMNFVIRMRRQHEAIRGASGQPCAHPLGCVT
jgi:hypothetical protein